MTFDLYKKRLNAYGGPTQVDKLNYRNQKLFNRAINDAFDSETMILNDIEEKVYRGLMLEDKLTLDIDQKWFALPNESNLHPGDVVKVIRNGGNTHWIMVQEDLSERSFKRCVGKRCVTQVSWRDDEDVVHTSWAALRGPTETSIKGESRGNFLFNRGNEKVSLWLPDTEATVGLRRYKYLMVEKEIWEIASVDYFTTPGILELALIEAQDNAYKDNLVDNIARDDYFSFTSLFENDSDFKVNEYISIEPVLMKNGIDITIEKESEFELIINSENYIYDKEHKMIKFLEVGEYEFTIGYPKLKIEKTYKVSIVEQEEKSETYYLIQGNSSIHPLINKQESYDIKYFIDGVESNMPAGQWKYNDSFAKIVSVGTYHIDLDFNGDIGEFDLTYEVKGEIVASKKIIIHSIFG